MFKATPPKSAKLELMKSAKVVCVGGKGGGRVVVSANIGRSRLQLKPATSPKLIIEKYPVVEAINQFIYQSIIIDQLQIVIESIK